MKRADIDDVLLRLFKNDNTIFIHIRLYVYVHYVAVNLIHIGMAAYSIGTIYYYTINKNAYIVHIKFFIIKLYNTYVTILLMNHLLFYIYTIHSILSIMII